MIVVGFFGYNAYALSFVEGTVFLEAQTQVECEAQDGNFIDWYGQIYCTEPMEKIEQIAEDDLIAEGTIEIETEEINSIEEEMNAVLGQIETEEIISSFTTMIQNFIQETLDSLIFWK